MSKVDAHLGCVVLDAGSTDGTVAAIRKHYPDAELMEGDSSQYWASGMAMAERAALRHELDYLLWLNDDVVLLSDALAELLRVSAASPSAVIVGSTVDPDEHDIVTYGGYRLQGRGIRPFNLERIKPSMWPSAVDTFNGNVVLVPVRTALAVGGIDPGFIHSYADLDYGHRVRSSGYRALLSPFVAGYCAGGGLRSEPDYGLPLIEFLRVMNTPKGAPWKAQVRYCRRHCRHFWAVFAAAPYLKAIYRHTVRRMARICDTGKVRTTQRSRLRG